MTMTTQTTSIDGQAGPELPADAGSKVDFSRKVNRLILLAAAAVLLNAVYDYSARPVEAKLLDQGDPIPEFSLNLLDGGQASRQGFMGRPMLYYFYANWCPCSHESVVNIRKAVEEGKAAGLGVMFVGIQDSRENLEKFARTHKLQFPVAVEGGQMFSDRVGISVTPTTVFVDSAGVVQSFFVGKVERFGQLEDGLKSIMPQGQPGATPSPA
ncbi:MAG: TlpA family protein disulfide reductase [Nitrospinota bacterium]|nr:TlpA family protein disulfide reductase [Nitrospinota bacterium]MDH5679069.1 TlpA family protein disulfide reductase [Nitrospinota bacterium]MDH5757073.1 TlpA family protein disulfide reductase [Nitrospinota bacterium]